MEIFKLFGTKDLYEILELERTATVNEIKRSYYNLARKYHPDRVSVENKSDATDKFNAIHQAYLLLTNDETRSRYDKGEVDVVFSKKTRSSQWEQHLKTISDDDFGKAAQEYKNSAKETEDIIREVVIGKGSMKHLLNCIPFMRVEDQPRILKMIVDLMKQGKIPKNIKVKKIA